MDRVEHYSVTGHTARDIREQLGSRSDSSGKPRHGMTRSTFEVVSKLEEAEGFCRVLQQEIVVEITTELPHWEPRRKPSSALQEEWRISVERLARHEAGHRQNVLQAAAKLREILPTLKPATSCLKARAEIELELERALDILERREVYYDRLTRQGLRDLMDVGNPLKAGEVDERVQPQGRRLSNPVRTLPME